MAEATSEDQGAAALDAGWAELAGGRWAAALACFERAVASEKTAEAHEGLSWAARWLDDADVVFAARDRAYRLYKQRGARPAAARGAGRRAARGPAACAELASALILDGATADYSDALAQQIHPAIVADGWRSAGEHPSERDIAWRTPTSCAPRNRLACSPASRERHAARAADSSSPPPVVSASRTDCVPAHSPLPAAPL